MNNINNKIVAKLRTLGKRKSGKGMKRGVREGERRKTVRQSILLYSSLFYKI